MSRSSGLAALLAGVALGAGLALLAGNSSLRPRGEPPEASAAPARAGEPAVYMCGMHPEVVRGEPGDCPICGMRLVARAPGQARLPESLAASAPAGDAAGHPVPGPPAGDGTPAADPMPADDGVQVSKRFLQNFAVRSVAARRGALPVSIRTVGVLAHNEERLVSVNTKFEGWIERARVNNVGESVERGDALFEVYSPELLTTQREYLAALDYVERLAGGGAHAEAISRARSLLGATRERLRLWDVPEERIAALAASRSAPRTLSFLAPASGFIVEKSGDSLEGLRLRPGMTVLKIADHATLWAQAEFYEADLRHAREGSRASIEVDAFPGRRWSGSILFFRSAVNPDTRTLTAFIEVANPDLALRPMMYVSVTLEAEGARDALLVPAESVLQSGERALVIVDRGGGTFEPREVRTGLASEGQREILSGLAEGEMVVVSSQFLIDSESNLNAAARQLLRGGDADAPPGAAGHRHH